MLVLDPGNAQAYAYTGEAFYQEDPKGEQSVEQAIYNANKAIEKDAALWVPHKTLGPDLPGPQELGRGDHRVQGGRQAQGERLLPALQPRRGSVQRQALQRRPAVLRCLDSPQGRLLPGALPAGPHLHGSRPGRPRPCLAAARRRAQARRRRRAVLHRRGPAPPGGPDRRRRGLRPGQPPQPRARPPITARRPRRC